MSAIASDTQRIETLLQHYGDGTKGDAPTRTQWEKILERGQDAPITLINFFKFYETARYAGDSELTGSGKEAFERYASVSGPALQRAGGKFLLVAPFEHMFAGEEEDWDVIAIGSYPGTTALLDLFEDKAYQGCFFHRTAACAKQKVYIASA
ncbi:DUF1330 domain-containing protein [Flexibacterium corallicola]|uniref:DUF1330 domain-containing protein n=1 Tax=Flexibacterium corallicola TaxID=3037259 RepID=UPI00286F4D16|nr:DUF1330 domain-containing protein [Pseudovibrio sp. M1P-2-3]